MINYLYKYLILFLCVVSMSNLFAQDLKIVGELDSTKIRIGEQVKIHLYATFNTNKKNIKINWPFIGDTLSNKIDVISVSKIDTILNDKTVPKNLIQHQFIVISAYDSGYFSIPKFKFMIDDDSSKAYFSNELFLEVHTVPTDTSITKIKDIKPPFEEPFNWKWYLNKIYWSFGSLVFIIIVILLTVFVLKRNKKIIPQPVKQKIAAHILALAALEKIKNEKIWKDQKIKEYYSSISDTIRLYIEDRFELHALESTTFEIMSAFRSQVIDNESKNKLQQLLMLSDLVKFAKQFPIEIEHDQTLQFAFDFVNGTKREDAIQNTTQVNS